MKLLITVIGSAMLFMLLCTLAFVFYEMSRSVFHQLSVHRMAKRYGEDVSNTVAPWRRTGEKL